LDEIRGYLDIENRRALLAQLEEQAARPEFWNDQNAAKEIIAKTNGQRAFVRPFDELVRLLDDGVLMRELAEAEEVWAAAAAGARRDCPYVRQGRRADFQATHAVAAGRQARRLQRILDDSFRRGR
jgi:peptide chain release factor 2